MFSPNSKCKNSKRDFFKRLFGTMSTSQKHIIYDSSFSEISYSMFTNSDVVNMTCENPDTSHQKGGNVSKRKDARGFFNGVSPKIQRQ